MINDERLGRALAYLVDTDETAAHFKADTVRAEYKAKAIKDAVYLRLSGSVADRQAQAAQDVAYQEAMEHYFAMLAQSEHVRNKRQTEIIVVELWRSTNANRRAGNI